jgi:hypothetical protein
MECQPVGEVDRTMWTVGEGVGANISAIARDTNNYKPNI